MVLQAFFDKVKHGLESTKASIYLMGSGRILVGIFQMTKALLNPKRMAWTSLAITELIAWLYLDYPYCNMLHRPVSSAMRTMGPSWLLLPVALAKEESVNTSRQMELRSRAVYVSPVVVVVLRCLITLFRALKSSVVDGLDTGVRSWTGEDMSGRVSTPTY